MTLSFVTKHYIRRIHKNFKVLHYHYKLFKIVRDST